MSVSKNLLGAFLLLCLIQATGQSFISGVITDESGDVLVGATVLEKGTSNGTISDVNGEFRFTLGSENSTIEISFLGFKSEEVILSGEEFIEIILTEDAKFLNEVEISGFAGSIGQARRRVESIQKIPESVTSVLGEDMQIANISNVEEFTQIVPNVSFQSSQNVGVNFVTVRGIPQIRNGEAPIAFVIDDVFIPDANLINQELYDVAMVEFVRGPQGSLYGKNAIGGAVNILTNSPVNKIKNNVLVGYGNGKTLKTRVSSSGAIIKNKFFYNVSGSYKDSEGVISNEFLGKPVDFYEDKSFRTRLKYVFTPRFSATISHQQSNTEGGAIYYGTSADGSGQMPANSFDYTIGSDQFGKSFLENKFSFLKIEYFFDNIYLRSVTSINNADRNHFGDLDYTGSDVLQQTQDSNSETFNQEIKIGSLGSDSRFSWDLGLFYQSSERYLYTEATADFGFFAPPFEATGVQSPLLVLSDFTNKYRTTAFYGFADYKISDKFIAAFGMRYDRDDIEQKNALTLRDQSKIQTEFQPKFSLSYQAKENIMAFANYGRGYRSGGFNTARTNFFDAEFKGETSDSYELGLKTSTADNRFIFNVSAFYIDFKNQQQYAVGLGAENTYIGIFNFPESEIKGFETEMKIRATSYLDILGGFGVNSSEITKGGRAGDLDRSSFSGNKTPYVPASTYNIALKSSFDLSDKVSFIGFINLNGKGKIYWHEDNQDTDVSDSFSLLDSRLALSFGQKVTVAFWGKNLTDKKYWQEYFAGEVSGSAAGDLGWIGEPRTYGLDLILNL